MNYLATALIGIGLILSTAGVSAQNVTHGAASYKLCAGCHGFKAQGNQAVDAPSLAGQEPWYLKRQINSFRDGLRGYADGDSTGHTMAQMTLGIDSDITVDDLVAYIGTLPGGEYSVAVDGNAQTGKGLYATCGSCHGNQGEGNAALNGPALTVLDDWYMLRQLRKFKSGQRGTQPGDIYGQQMAPMATVLADDQAMADVIAYINSLR